MRAEMPKKYWRDWPETMKNGKAKIGDETADDWSPAPVPKASSLRALAKAGINRDEVYVTNTVKHFKWEPRREAAHSSKAEFTGNRGLPPMAGSRTETR